MAVTCSEEKLLIFAKHFLYSHDVNVCLCKIVYSTDCHCSDLVLKGQ